MNHSFYSGQLIHAELNPEAQEMSIISFKHIPALSVWEKEQAERMMKILSEALRRQEQQFVVTVRDSLPVLLHKEEMLQLQQELSEAIELLSEEH